MFGATGDVRSRHVSSFLFFLRVGLSIFSYYIYRDVCMLADKIIAKLMEFNARLLLPVSLLLQRAGLIEP